MKRHVLMIKAEQSENTKINAGIKINISNVLVSNSVDIEI